MLSQRRYRNYHQISLSTRTLSAQAQAQVKVEGNDEVEWNNAKPFSSLPGPSKLGLLRSVMPGGRYHNLHFLELNKKIYKGHGPIPKFPGLFGKPDMVFTFDPKDIKYVFGNGGQ